MELISISSAVKKYGKTRASINSLLKRERIKKVGKMICLQSFLEYYDRISIVSMPYNVSEATIKDIVNKKTWNHI